MREFFVWLLPNYKDIDVLVLTGVVALCLPWVWNLLADNKTAANQFAQENEGARERVLRESFEQGKVIEVWLENGVSYIGIAASDPVVQESSVIVVPWSRSLTMAEAFSSSSALGRPRGWLPRAAIHSIARG